MRLISHANEQRPLGAKSSRASPRGMPGQVLLSAHAPGMPQGDVTGTATLTGTVMGTATAMGGSNGSQGGLG